VHHVRPLEPYVFVVDRCLGRKAVPDALRRHLRKAERVFHLEELSYPHDVHDDVWIPEVGAKGYVILTKDDAIRRRPNEQAALVAASTAAFVFTNGNAKSDRIATAMVAALPRVREAVRRFEVPLLGRINLDGEVTVSVVAGAKLEKPRHVTKKG